MAPAAWAKSIGARDTRLNREVAVKIGEARVLMDTRIAGWDRSNYGTNYAAAADGQRFLINTASDAALPITLVLNWRAALGKRPQ